MRALSASLLIFCVLSSFEAGAQTTFPLSVPPSSPVPQALDYAPGFPSANFSPSLQWFLDTFQPVRFQVTEPYEPPSTIQIQLAIGNLDYSIAGTIFVVPPAAVTNETLTSPSPLGFVHEVMHQGLPPVILEKGADFNMVEARASGEASLVYLTLRNENPSLFPATGNQPTTTCAPGIDMFNNRKMTVYGGAGGSAGGASGGPNYYANLNNDFNGSCALLAHFVTSKLGGDYRSFDHALGIALPDSRDDFYALVDGFGVTIDGVKPSTFFRRDPTNYFGNPNGLYFGISGGGGSDPLYNDLFGDWPFNPVLYFPVLANVSTVNGEQIPSKSDGSFSWEMVNSLGVVVLSKAAKVSDPFAMAFYDGSDVYANLPNGAYLIKACLVNSAGACETDPELSASDVFPILRGEELDPGDVAVIVNGPRWGELTPNRTLTLLSPDPHLVTVESYPNLVIYRHLPQNKDGSYQDITVTDGTLIRTFTPDRYAPTARTFVSIAEPVITAVVRATDFVQTSVVAPGGLYTIFGWVLINNDPVTASKYPLSTKGCPGTSTNDQGPTEVTFSLADGTRYLAPILYCGSNQLNVQVPNELPIGKKAAITVSVNGTSSKSITFSVVDADPAIFAAIFATGPRAGQLVTSQNPAVQGDVLSLFGTGFGETMVPAVDGVPMASASPTLNGPVSVTIGGIPAKVLYAGSAPGFVGLDQVNLAVPSGISPGDSNLVVTIGDGGNGVSPTFALVVAGN
jgi:uncharacterized protein (TIGR03437 family)